MLTVIRGVNSYLLLKEAGLKNFETQGERELQHEFSIYAMQMMTQFIFKHTTGEDIPLKLSPQSSSESESE